MTHTQKKASRSMKQKPQNTLCTKKQKKSYYFFSQIKKVTSQLFASEILTLFILIKNNKSICDDFQISLNCIKIFIFFYIV